MPRPQAGHEPGHVTEHWSHFTESLQDICHCSYKGLLSKRVKSARRKIPGSLSRLENSWKLVRARECLEAQQGWKMIRISLKLVEVRKYSRACQGQRMKLDKAEKLLKACQGWSGKKILERSLGLEIAQKLTRAKKCSNIHQGQLGQEKAQKLAKALLYCSDQFWPEDGQDLGPSWSVGYVRRKQGQHALSQDRS